MKNAIMLITVLLLTVNSIDSSVCIHSADNVFLKHQSTLSIKRMLAAIVFLTLKVMAHKKLKAAKHMQEINMDWLLLTL